MKQNNIKIAIIIGLYFSGLSLLGQDNGIRPQIWSNASVVWNANEKFALRSNAAFNFLLSSISPWNEISLSSVAVYKFHRFFEASGGFYAARARQSEDLKSFEYRSFVGFRMATNTEKRWLVTNLTRFELRHFTYSDRESETGYRFRNRTYGVVSLIKPKMSADKNLYLFGYFEAFYNFETEVRERFFNQFIYKLGLGYRLSYPWRFDIGLIYQDAKNTSAEPVPLNVNIITNWIIDWGVVYVIPSK